MMPLDGIIMCNRNNENKMSMNVIHEYLRKSTTKWRRKRKQQIAKKNFHFRYHSYSFLYVKYTCSSIMVLRRCDFILIGKQYINVAEYEATDNIAEK